MWPYGPTTPRLHGPFAIHSTVNALHPHSWPLWKTSTQHRVYTRFSGGTNDLYGEQNFSFKLVCRGGGWHIRYYEVRLKGLAEQQNNQSQEAFVLLITRPTTITTKHQ